LDHEVVLDRRVFEKSGYLDSFPQLAGAVFSFEGTDAHHEELRTRVHEGKLWLCVLSGKLRLVLGDRDLVLGPGEIAEFDTHTPHWIGSADSRPVEILNLFGPQGERAHTTARTAAHDDGAAPEH